MSDHTTEAAHALLASAAPLVAEHAELERSMADPELHADQSALRRTTKRYAALGPVVAAYRALAAARADLAAAHELAGEDPDFAAELPAIEAVSALAQSRLHTLLLPRDPDDDRDAILEVKAGEGGDESALFAGDLLRMYLRYAERRGWKTEVLDETQSDLGGVKEARIALRAKGTPDIGEAPWARLKFEGGVHRVQRVPVTESQGRIHTSAAGVLVMPDIDEGDDEVEIAPADLRIDVYRSSGPGGQSVNTTDSAVRITHLPTGVVVSCQNEKSQLQNKESALRVLKARLRQAAREAAEATASAARRSQVRTVDRSERIRTYNFPENRIADHRTGFKAYNLDVVLDGELDAVIQSCMDADEVERMAGAGEVGRS
ncbi:MAG: peptide chain release factor 1 [Actinomycetales bacterium]|jgi:peptide chain release factor 1|uniref:Peptide chain release factor 1 n=1 Tax=Candidatus Phosphoribacter hodrii TaxID=2953743 RepID=A0A935IM58_9MICO|nr:peptide chain release factor 1 [Candidatus Phosphoribacter hodrii]HNV14644.1 peptide chain release factor 1 [Dermatophilaceae bacterium]MBK7271641.1 peptide chain release factor 1 [Candidatus Phosphoribacter hodrii]MBL0005258.1 peptide chain release factor 1 [Candidatus Phosphoribacter hodrii]HOA03597.1 peptide chain release factor 1 [Dermatophilaceae bacterium]